MAKSRRTDNHQKVLGEKVEIRPYVSGFTVTFHGVEGFPSTRTPPPRYGTRAVSTIDEAFDLTVDFFENPPTDNAK